LLKAEVLIMDNAANFAEVKPDSVLE